MTFSKFKSIAIFKNIINTFNTDTWAKIAVSAVLIFVMLFLMYHFSYSTSRKRVAFVISVFSLLVACISVAMAFQKERLVKADNPAIIFAQESRVKLDPNQTSEEIFRLHEGTKVQVLETYGNWKNIQISDKSKGWIPSKDLKMLKDL